MMTKVRRMKIELVKASKYCNKDLVASNCKRCRLDKLCTTQILIEKLEALGMYTHTYAEEAEPEEWRSDVCMKGMELIDASEGVLRCRVCGQITAPIIHEGGRFPRVSWQCPNGCTLEPQG